MASAARANADRASQYRYALLKGIAADLPSEDRALGQPASARFWRFADKIILVAMSIRGLAVRAQG